MKKFFYNLFTLFEALYVNYQTAKELNEDGSWDKYWAKKSMKAELKVLKFNYHQDRESIKNKWMKPFKKGR